MNIVLFHCPDGVTCHQHPVSGLDNAPSGSFIAPDHEYLAYIEITLTATDSTGATASVTRRLDAQTRTITMHSSPSGIALGLNDESVVTPFVRTVIRNSNNTVSAPPTAVVGGKSYRFDHWSDNGAAVHNVAPNLNTTTAYYVLDPTGGATNALLVVVERRFAEYSRPRGPRPSGCASLTVTVATTTGSRPRRRRASS
jgi:hypothetical protein